jgi:hypothetical protein
MERVDGREGGDGQARAAIDAQWITDRIALGGWIETPEKIRDARRSGITHILSMAWEFDETELAAPYGIRVFLNTVEDDFAPKSPEVLGRGVEFALRVLEQPDTKLLIHCVAGRHRGPMMALAVLCALGWPMDQAMRHIAEIRPVVDWAPVYVESVANFIGQYLPGMGSSEAAAQLNADRYSP